MATILQHKKTQEKFILLGAGYGRSHGQYNKEGFDLGDALTPEAFTSSTVEQTYLCVTKKDGSIWWVKDDDVEVYKIDGMSPEKALSC